MNDTKGIESRRISLDILKEITVKKRALDEVLKSHREYNAQDKRDKSFCRMLVATILRRQGQINDILRRALKNPDKKVKPPIAYRIMQMGIAQILFMDVPDHAAVNISVELAQNCGAEERKSLINGILRTVAREGKTWTTEQDVARLNTPKWLLDEWIKDYGLGTAIEIASANLSEASLDFSIRDKDRLDEWADILDGNILPTGTIRRKDSAGVNVIELDGFEAGSWWVQDISASIAVKIMGNIKDKNVADICAAPGGKTIQLACAGANVIAIDRSARRMQRLQENIIRIGIEDNVKIEVADALVWEPKENLDMILLDAPCSATGTIRRHPDLIHVKDPTDQSKLANLQSRLLDKAFDILPSGGVIIYCTCSLQKEEGEYQIDKFLERQKDAKRVPIGADEVDNIEGIITSDGDVRILPYHMAARGGMDGFFVSRLVKS